MTDAVVSAAEQAALPTASAVVDALDAFIVNINLTDPTNGPLRLSGALKILLGQIELQAPALATAEGAALQTDALNVLAAWKAKIVALETPAK